MNLNPGIAKTVAWLNENGFETTDSGDGETHDFECDRGYPYVVIRVDADKLIPETDRLFGLLGKLEIAVAPLSDDVNAVGIQATYDPANKLCFIDLMGLNDKALLSAQKMYFLMHEAS